MGRELDIAAATQAFYAALDVMFTGDAAPMKALWSHAEDVSYMGPDGKYLVGWTAVGAEWDRQASLLLGGHVEPSRVHTVMGTDLAMITCVEVGVNENGIAGKAVSIRSSTVFRLEGGTWKVIGHQTDTLPYI